MHDNVQWLIRSSQKDIESAEFSHLATKIGEEPNEADYPQRSCSIQVDVKRIRLDLYQGILSTGEKTFHEILVARVLQVDQDNLSNLARSLKSRDSKAKQLGVRANGDLHRLG